MSVMHRVHKWVDGLEEGQVVNTPVDILDELVGLAALLPLARTNLRAKV